jgi:hypothetical protein
MLEAALDPLGLSLDAAQVLGRGFGFDSPRLP